jgi:hypothetical protein
MGEVSVAVDDELLDPFVNPAKAVRLEGLHVVSAPMYYSISLQRSDASSGSAFSFPLGLLFRSHTLFGGVYWAQQKLSTETQPMIGLTPSAFSPSESSPTNNTYTFALAGTTLLDGDVALAASVLWADLNAVEGVRFLYPASRNVRQNGSATQYRIGALGKLDENEFIEAVILRSKYSMEYQLARQDVWLFDSRTSAVLYETHQDQTDLWGLRLAYVRPLAGTWRIGSQVTANWKYHPKIPNYEIMNIPRDPGNSSAYNLGVGLSTQKNGSVFGVDVIYEPIRTETWADAAQVITRQNGSIVRAGEKTVENFFDFSNWIARAGLRASRTRTEFQLGLQVHSISYHLHQIDNVQHTKRDLDESWNEWTLSLGLGFRIFSVDVRYTGLMTMGTGQPRAQTAWGSPIDGRAAMDSMDFLPAPGGRLSLSEAWVFTHQVSLAVRIF